MANVKISDLPAASSAGGTDQLETNQAGTSRRLTVAQVATHVRSNATDTVVVAAGSASAPSISPTGDSNTGLFAPAADTLAFATGGTERLRLNSSGQAEYTLGTASLPSVTATGDTNTGVYFPGADRVGIATGGTQRAEFDASGNFLFNSGYGSVAVGFGCRAWVNFNGTGTVAIRASGNVSSITDLGAGDYQLNLGSAMPDTNYSVLCTKQNLLTNVDVIAADAQGNRTTSTVRVVSIENNTLQDTLNYNVAIFR